MKNTGNLFLACGNKSKEELFNVYLYLERYVNDGSASGFDLNMPFEYSPFNPNQYVELTLVEDYWHKHLQIGKIPNAFKCNDIDKNPFFIHPYILEKVSGFKSLFSNIDRKLSVEPTASGRTVLWNDGVQTVFIKLHFPIKLGRFNRDINLFRWLSILERSRELYSSILVLPRNFCFLHDFGGTFYQNENSELCFGTIFRGTTPIPHVNSSSLLIPSFSLFAVRRNDGREKSILAEMIEFYKIDQNHFFKLLIFPVIDCYIFLIDKLGMIPELNAQNLLYEFDLVNTSTRIVIRDLGDCFIDFAIRERNNQHTNFCSYKTLDPTIHNDIFQRRSFAYDFKLSHYLLYPLIKEYSQITGKKIDDIVSIVKFYFLDKFPNHLDYFGSSKWYSYPDEENVSRNGYIENDNPLFR